MRKQNPVTKEIHAMTPSSLRDMFKIVYLTASASEKRRIRRILIPDKKTRWIIYCKKCKEFHYKKTRIDHKAIFV